jgi:hypothetical protein
MKVATRALLDGLQCQAPGCTHEDHDDELYLHSRCHPRAGTIALYMRGGTLRILCALCQQPVVVLAIK